MASTVLGDVNFLSEPFAATLQGEFTHRLGFLTSGVMSPIPAGLIKDQGYTAAIPKWNALDGDPDQITTSLTTTINSLTDVKDIAVWVEREKAWGADQMIRVVAGQDKDVTKEVARQLGEYWAGVLHNSGMQVLKGTFATALATTHSTGSTYSGANITVEGGLAAKYKLGDNSDVLTTFLTNSKVKTDMVNDKIATYDKAAVDTYLSGEVLSFLGANVVTTDKLAAVSTVYPSYFASQGALAYTFRPRQQNAFNNANVFSINAGGINIEVELARNSTTAGGQDYIITRASYLVHLPGVKWASATTNPTNAQLATGSNWSKVYTDDKLIKIVELKTK